MGLPREFQIEALSGCIHKSALSMAKGVLSLLAGCKVSVAKNKRKIAKDF